MEDHELNTECCKDKVNNCVKSLHIELYFQQEIRQHLTSSVLCWKPSFIW